MSTIKKIPMKLYHKIVMVILLTCLIPLVLLSVFTLYTFNTRYTELIGSQYDAEIEKSASVLEYYLDVFFNALEQNGSGENWKRALSGTDEAEKDDRVTALLKELADSNSYIRNCLFVDNEDHVYLYSKDGNRLVSSAIFFSQNRYTEIGRRGGEPFLNAIHKTPYYDHKEQSVCTVGKRLLLPEDMGTIYLELDPAAFDIVFSDKDLYGRGYLRILGPDGEVVYEREQDVDKRAASIAANLQQLVYSREVPGKGLAISFSIDKVTVLADIYVLRGIMILVILCCLTMILIVSSRFSRQLTEPIHGMIAEMDKLKTGDFDVRLPVKTRDELGILSENFNEMSRQLQLYINQSYVARLKEKEAELTALKSQIYPHFLYNTLEVIRMTAFDQEDEKVADMIEALSEQMRYIIGTAQDVVPLRMEVEVLRKYIWLINCRYEGKVQFEVNAEGMMDCMIPKLILQPIVENAFFHGLRPGGGEGVIALTAERTEGLIAITIMDNGVGMRAEEKEKLEELLLSDRPGNREEYNWQSIGLKNVHDRLRYIYGEQYGITIISHENIGTAVCAKIPENLEVV